MFNNQALRQQPAFLPTLAPEFAKYCTSAIIGGFLWDIARKVAYPTNDGIGSSPNGLMSIVKPTGTAREKMAWSNSSGGTVQYYKLGSTDSIIPTGNNCTILWQAYKNSQTGAQGALGNNIAASSQEVNIYLPYSADNNVYWRWGGETNNITSLNFAPTAVSPGDWWAFVAAAGGRGMEIWQNFRKMASNGGNQSRSSGATSLYWGAAIGLTAAAEMQSSMFAVFNRALPASFLASGNYWRIFNPMMRPQVFGVPASGAPMFLPEQLYPQAMTGLGSGMGAA